jgi:hypothetical protein
MPLGKLTGLTNPFDNTREANSSVGREIILQQNPWKNFLLEKLIVTQLVKTFSAF